MRIHITGIAGMIGYHLARKLHDLGYDVVGVDDMNTEYDGWMDLRKPFDHGTLKNHRRMILNSMGIEVSKEDFLDYFTYGNVDQEDVVVHLAAYANPRHSMQKPYFYYTDNAGKTNAMIKKLEYFKTSKVIYASTSCVMHEQPLPWRESDRPSHQICPYGWSKWANECDFGVSNIDTAVGLRFFTVYGPFGRPDMALFNFARAVDMGQPVTLFTDSEGKFLRRDFTYVDDIANGICSVLFAMQDGRVSGKEIFNIGRGKPMDVYEFVTNIGKRLKKPVEIISKMKPSCDVDETWADTSKIQKLGWIPQTTTEDGVAEFISWYKGFYDR